MNTSENKENEKIDEFLFDNGFHPCLDFGLEFNYQTAINFFRAAITHYKINLNIYKFDRSDLELLFNNYSRSVIIYNDIDYLQEITAIYDSTELLHKHKVSRKEIDSIQEDINQIEKRILNGASGKLYT